MNLISRFLAAARLPLRLTVPLTLTLAWPLALASLCLCLSTTAYSADSLVMKAVGDAINQPGRPNSDIIRDSKRKPKEVLLFFGVKPGMKVLDVYATGGYYTELLSHIVGANGKVISHNSQAYRQFIGQSINDRFVNGRLANVEQYFNHPRAVQLEANTLDMTIMIAIFHDLFVTNATNLIKPEDRHNLLQQVYKALKPGGILGIVDHSAKRGSDESTATELHRITPTLVTDTLKQYGFEFVAESKALRNHNDPLDISIFDKKIRRETDRFILKFRKPMQPQSTAAQPSQSGTTQQ